MYEGEDMEKRCLWCHLHVWGEWLWQDGGTLVCLRTGDMPACACDQRGHAGRPGDTMLGSLVICELCQCLQQADNMEDCLAELLLAVKQKTGWSFLHTVCFYGGSLMGWLPCGSGICGWNFRVVCVEPCLKNPPLGKPLVVFFFFFFFLIYSPWGRTWTFTGNGTWT